MKVTNKHNAPATLMTLATTEYYSKGAAQYSVTEIMGPPKIRRLREQYNDQITTDVSDMLWQLLGSALHVVMERGQTENHITEERLFTVVNGATISGQIDLQEVTPQGIIITDYKLTSGWAVMQNKAEWEEQLNIYKWLVEVAKKEKVTALYICALIRDFDKHSHKEGYPEAPIHMLSIPLWTAQKAQEHVEKRIALHSEAKMKHELGEALDDCTNEERWMSETIYAVKKEGRKNAVKNGLFTSKEAAEKLAIEEKGYVEIRLAEPKRCTGNYCGVAEWCTQYQESK